MAEVDDSGIRPRKRRALFLLALFGVDGVASVMVRLGVGANAITLGSLVLAIAAAILLSGGHLGLAALAMTLSSLGDAIDGRVARRAGTASVGGALLDASVDRYEELLFLGGCALFLRTPGALVLVFAAIAGSFMVSYGSAKAEALGAPVPPSAMRRPQRAVVLCAGTALCAAAAWIVRYGRFALPDWTERLPLLSALACIAVVGNVSAIRRLRSLARVQPSAGRPGLRSLPVAGSRGPTTAAGS